MRAFVHIRNLAQRWFMFQNMGPSPSGRSGHAMASHGTRVFVLGGESSAVAQVDETAMIHVLDTSMSIFVVAFGLPSRPKVQSTSSTRNLILILLSNPVTRCPWRGSHPRASQLRSNRNSLHRVPTLHARFLLFNKILIPRSCAALSPRKI
jgi:hypothetical protein